MNVKVSMDQLRRSLAGFMDDESAGLMKADVGEIHAIDEAGNQWPIKGLAIAVAPAKPPRPVGKEIRTGTGATMRLAAVNGETV